MKIQIKEIVKIFVVTARTYEATPDLVRSSSLFELELEEVFLSK